MVELTLTVTNTVERPRSEAAQVCIGDPDAIVDRVPRELTGFESVRLDRGESARVRIALDERAFAVWSDGDWVVEPGSFTITVAASRDPRLTQTIELRVPPPPIAAIDAESTQAEWLANPAGATVIAAAFPSAGPDASRRPEPSVTPSRVKGILRTAFRISDAPAVG